MNIKKTYITPWLSRIKQYFSQRKGLLIIALIFIIIVCPIGCVLYDDLTVQLTEYDVYAEDLPLAFFGYRMMVVSDFHDSFFSSQVAHIINKEKPDMVLFLGDMTRLDRSSMNNTKHLLKEIKIDAPIYGVLGNQEVWAQNADKIESQLEDAGMHILNHEVITLEKQNANIQLIGLQDISNKDTDLSDSWELSQAQEYLDNNVNPSAFTILACHRANLYPYLNNKKVDLMLAGHLHGGIIRFPFLGGILNVDGGFMPQYDAGFYKETDTALIVSRGCDFQWKRLRVLNGPEVVSITLKR